MYNPDSQEPLKEISGLLMTTQEDSGLALTVSEVYLILGALQLTTTFPEISDAYIKVLTDLGRKLQDRIVEMVPEAEALLEMGWDRNRDVIRCDNRDKNIVWSALVPSRLEEICQTYGPGEWTMNRLTGQRLLYIMTSIPIHDAPEDEEEEGPVPLPLSIQDQPVGIDPDLPDDTILYRSSSGFDAWLHCQSGDVETH